MNTSIDEMVARIRPQAGVPLLACDCISPTPQDGTAWLWVFHENARNRLRPRWSGVLPRAEIAELVSRLRQRTSVWLGGIDTRHGPPARWFRLVWTLSPAPCRIYTRRGLAIDVEAGLVARHRHWRREQIPVRSSSVVEGWINWAGAGISLKGPEGEEDEVIRLKNASTFTQFLVMYDGIDLMMDTWWLDGVVPRVAEALGLGWKIVDYTESPPKVVRESGPELAPAKGDE